MIPTERKRYETLLRHARGMIGALEELLASDGHQPPTIEHTGTHDASRRNTEETSWKQSPEATR
jgi:hypothetical protein